MKGCLVTALVVLAGCAGESGQLDTATLETAIPSALVPDAPELVTGVRCPVEISRGVGLATGCTASINGTTVAIRVEQTDDQGSVRVTTDAVLLKVENLADDLAEELARDIGVEVSASCAGPSVLVPAAGQTLNCTALDTESRPIEFVVTLTDALGGYEVRITD